MKKLRLFVAGVCLAVSLNAQWNQNSSNIYYNQGYVGLGMTPSNPLHIEYNISSGSLLYGLNNQPMGTEAMSYSPNLFLIHTRLDACLGLHAYVYRKSASTSWTGATVRLSSAADGPWYSQDHRYNNLNWIDFLGNGSGIDMGCVSNAPALSIRDKAVGIGTISPSSQLHLASDADHAFTISRSDGTYGFRILRNAQQGSVYFQIATSQNTWETKIKIGEGEGANTKLLLNPDGGNVGIGTTFPQALFQVGSGVAPGLAEAAGRGLIQINSSNGLENMSGLEFKTSAYSAGYGWKIVSQDLLNNYTPLIIGSRTGAANWTERIRIDNVTGNVLIGKTSQNEGANYKLDVNGSIRANAVVCNTTGADFVFEPTYQLRPLSEVETFIKAHKHLPEIAPAADMQANGVSMGEMQAKLLQKVEELTLYSIVQSKQLQEQRQSNAELQQQLATQAKEIEQLKQLINQKLK